MESSIKSGTKTRRKIKTELVHSLGGECNICGYKKSMAALNFHHMDPTEKVFLLGSYPKKSERIKEIKKCQVLCANCHYELHANEYEMTLSAKNKIIKTCKIHGEALFYSFNRKGKNNKETCAVCMIERQTRVRRKIKNDLVALMGGGCSRCGYCKENKALDFHHISNKKQRISALRRFDLAQQEVKSCILLCKNCHAEEHWSN